MKKFISLLFAFIVFIGANAMPNKERSMQRVEEGITFHKVHKSWNASESEPASPSAPRAPESEEGLPPFMIVVTDIGPRSATVTVTPVPADNTDTYYFDLVSKSEASGKSNAEIISAIVENLQEVIAYYKKLGYKISLADALSSGKDSYTFKDLDPATEYIAVAFKLDAKGNAGNVLVKKEFKTADAPDASKGTFTIKVSDTGQDSTLFEITPSVEALYYCTYARTASIEGMSDADIMSKIIKEDMDYMIDYYAENNVTITYADLMTSTSEKYKITGLIANTSYTIIAAYLNEKTGALIGTIGKKSFTTSKAEKVNLTFDFEETLTGIKVTPSDLTYPWDWMIVNQSDYENEYESNKNEVAQAVFDYYGSYYAGPGGLEFTYEMLEEDFEPGEQCYLVAWGSKGAITSTVAMHAFKMPGGETAIDNQLVNGKCENEKILKDGQVLIVRDGKEYTILGIQK